MGNKGDRVTVETRLDINFYYIDTVYFHFAIKPRRGKQATENHTKAVFPSNAVFRLLGFFNNKPNYLEFDSMFDEWGSSVAPPASALTTHAIGRIGTLVQLQPMLHDNPGVLQPTVLNLFTVPSIKAQNSPSIALISGWSR